jgi:hypothetical protein
VIDNDLPFEPRLITEEEAKSFPKHGQPKEPSAQDEEEKIRKIKDEEEHGHPAFAMRDRYRSLGEKVE